MTIGLVLMTIAAGGCGEKSETEPGSGPHWTARQAESITSIRGMRVRVRSCRGIGVAARGDGEPGYRRFHCLAGARATPDPYGFDTVAVFYVLHPLVAYAGPTSRHRVANVRFVGGPGIP